MKTEKNYFLSGILIVFLLAGFVNGQIFSWSVLPENQTLKVDNRAEYKIEINISAFISGRAECFLDNERFEANAGANIVKKKVVFAPYAPRTTIISHSLYCRLFDYAFSGKAYSQNETKQIKILFEPYPMMVRTYMQNYTIINCTNPSALMMGRVYNDGVNKITCSYSKIQNGASEKTMIPSSIEPSTYSTFYLSVSLDDTPGAVKIFCYDAFNQSFTNTTTLKIDYDNSVSESITKCREDIGYLKTFTDTADETLSLEKAVKFREEKECYWAKFYAEKCLNSTTKKKKEIEDTNQKKQSEEQLNLIKEEMKKNASNLISRLKDSFSGLTDSSKNANVFIKSATDLLEISQKRFWDANYEESIKASTDGLKDIEKAKEIIKKEQDEAEKELEKEKEKSAKENASAEQNKKIAVTDQGKTPDLLIMGIIAAAALIIALFFILKIRKDRNKAKKT